ncbi:hypothetical protein LCGC14_0779000 [marine sediment metagenome]|uniref:Uncharacterized protein n=1 Tax=marine sediment metagenome TaxID=412755 RepID=A0A0F9SFY5_9ZZZZ
MPRDLPDWGAQSSQVTVHEITDLGELAVRLGSIVSFDRRGDVMWFDDFESGITKWVTSASGTGASVAASDNTARNGKNSVLLTGGSDGTRQAELRRDMPFLSLSSLGFEVSFSKASLVQTMEFVVQIWDGTNRHDYKIRYSDADDELQYWSSTEAWVTLATDIDLGTTASLFDTLKMVVDLSGEMYVRVLFNERQLPMDDIDVKLTASGATPFLRVFVLLTSRDGENDIVYVDDVILTQNEPANA